MKKILKNNCLVVLVGPSGAGKSTFAQKYFLPGEVISSDAIREELCGNFRDLSRDKEVFRLFADRVEDLLMYHKRAVVDATNLTLKARQIWSDLSIQYEIKLFYIVINRPMNEKQRDGGWRKELPFLMPKHEKTFKENEAEILSGDGGIAIVIDTRIEQFEIE